ncbi:MAG: hypothetical protein IJS08_03980, partial [Victivallales bacterium]|nr:hypothetical protein [Victivallales bacterium]
FQNGAVFQRRISIPVWGTTDGNCPLKAKFADVEIWGRSALDGSFMLRFPPMEAGGPYTLSISNMRTGDTAEISDVLVGEVWLASGQSNMAYKLGTDWARSPMPASGERLNMLQNKEFSSLNLEPARFRYISVPVSQTGAMEGTFHGAWHRITPGTAANVSAVAAWFGYYIKEKLDVPVGLVITAYGGSTVETWTSRSALMRNPVMRPLMEEIDGLATSPKAWGINTEKNDFEWGHDDEAPENLGFAKGYANIDYDDSDAKPFMVPGSWKLQKLAGNGVVWGRKRINIPKHWEGKELLLHLGGIDKTDITYFNGVEIGRTGQGHETCYWDSTREYTIPGNLVHEGEALLAVRAYSAICDGSFNGSPYTFSLELNDGTYEQISLAGEWKLLVELDIGDIQPVKLESQYGVSNHNTPAMLFNSMLRPLIPYAIRGVIWYQGENNAHTMEDARLYCDKLSGMIDDWRFRWGQGDFPFLQVQLANYKEAADYDQDALWAMLREKQAEVCKRMAHVYMASAVDVGEDVDVHPQDKKSVGYRLAQNAFTNVYRLQSSPGEGPVYERCETCGCKMRLVFSSSDGLCLKGEHPERAFVVAGADRVFHPADFVEIQENTVLVASSKVPSPRAVRYAWSNNPSSTLYNCADMPASPFRTDSYFI